MVCARVPLLLKQNVGVLFGVLSGPHSDVPFLYKNFSVCIMNFVIVVSEHADLMPSEDGQLAEACKGKKYLQIESHWMVLTIIL
jgi:hypothetical protein